MSEKGKSHVKVLSNNLQNSIDLDEFKNKFKDYDKSIVEVIDNMKKQIKIWRKTNKTR